MIVPDRVRGLGVVVFTAVLLSMVGQAVADGVSDPLQPIPQLADPTMQLPADGQPAAWQSAAVVNQTMAAPRGDAGFVYHDLLAARQPDMLWFRTDYLMWWTSGVLLPPLVTTSPPGTSEADAGVLGKLGTAILFGDQAVGNDARSGFRTSIGMWLDNYDIWSFEFEYLSPGGQSSGFHSTSTDDPILARPYFDVGSGQQTSILTAYPDIADGSLDVEAKDYFQSFALSVSYNVSCSNGCRTPFPPGEIQNTTLQLCDMRIDLIGAFRCYNLNDSVTITDRKVDIAPDSSSLGTIYDTRDNFRVRNDFYGGELGLRGQFNRGRWSLELLTKVALGNNRSVATIGGWTTETLPGGTRYITDSGMLARTSNSGTYTSDTFTVIPEWRMDLGYQWTRHLRTHVGYDVIIWRDVTRAGAQIDLNIGQAAAAGSSIFPVFPGRTTTFLAQGLNVGAEFRF